MKQALILWAGAALLTFLAGYYNSVTSPWFPVTGTIGVEGKKLTYRFDKATDDSLGYFVVIRTDRDSLAGSVWHRRPDGKDEWHRVPLTNGTGVLTARLPKYRIGEKTEYYAEAAYNGKAYRLPEDQTVIQETRGRIPRQISGVLLLTLFGGLLLAMRTGLEYFRENSTMKKLALFTLISLGLYAIVVTPVAAAYRLGAISTRILQPQDMFEGGALLLFTIWTAGTIGMFNSKHWKVWGAATAAVTLFAFLVIHRP